MKHIRTLLLAAAMAVTAAFANAATPHFSLNVTINVTHAGGGIIISPDKLTRNYLMWEFVKNGTESYICRHVFVGGNDYYDDVPTQTFDLKANTKVKLDVEGSVVKTYINGTLIDTFTDTRSVLRNDSIGFYASNLNNEKQIVAFDDVTAKRIADDGAETTYIDTDFSSNTKTYFDEKFVKTINGNPKLYLNPSSRTDIKVIVKYPYNNHDNEDYVKIDPMSDTWVTEDDLGRVVASADNVVTNNAIGKKSKVGIFYYVWHGQHGDEIKDVTKLLAKDPVNPAWGNPGQPHWWGEPAMGYYKGGDPFIIAKHMQMLVDAGIDFLFFDMTNALIYSKNVLAVMKEIDRRRKLGLKAPQLACMFHSAPGTTLKKAYIGFYKHNPYNNNDIWFHWQGKPLALVDANDDEVKALPASIRDYFTMRFSWAWLNGKIENAWPWLENYPQQPGWTTGNDGNKETEQLTVCVAQHAHTKIGRSYHNKVEPNFDKYGLCKETPYGYNFAEQWKRAFEIHPPVLMITQWNEWIAGRFLVQNESDLSGTRPGATPRIGESMFIDEYNQEFSRDSEPSRNPLIRDNYYMQLISNMRKYKGARKIPVPTVSKEIDIDGSFAQWDNIDPKFIDEPGDVDFTSETAQQHGVDSVTNDIVLCRVTKDINSLYFYAQTRADIAGMTKATKSRHMSILINSDRMYNTGWYGYDYMISPDDNMGMAVYAYNKETSAWVETAKAKYRIEGNQMMVAVDKAALELSGDKTFDFKWVDNVLKSTTDILDFYASGECAPNGRFNYRYKGAELPSSGVELVGSTDATALHITRPASDVLNVEFEASATGKAAVTVYNLQGIVVAKTHTTVAQGANMMVLNCPQRQVIVKVDIDGKTLTGRNF